MDCKHISKTVVVALNDDPVIIFQFIQFIFWKFDIYSFMTFKFVASVAYLFN